MDIHCAFCHDIRYPINCKTWCAKCGKLKVMCTPCSYKLPVENFCNECKEKKI
jgi:hypothetical protein